MALIRQNSASSPRTSHVDSRRRPAPAEETAAIGIDPPSRQKSSTTDLDLDRGHSGTPTGFDLGQTRNNTAPSPRSRCGPDASGPPDLPSHHSDAHDYCLGSAGRADKVPSEAPHSIDRPNRCGRFRGAASSPSPRSRVTEEVEDPMLGQRPALKRAAAAATAPQAAGTPVAATSGRCKIVYSSNDILHVHSQPDANSFALGHLWPSGTGATIACLDDIPQNVDGAQYNLCGGSTTSTTSSTSGDRRGSYPRGVRSSRSEHHHDRGSHSRGGGAARPSGGPAYAGSAILLHRRRSTWQSTTAGPLLPTVASLFRHHRKP